MSTRMDGAAPSVKRQGGSLHREIAREVLRLGRQEHWVPGTAVQVLPLAKRLGVSRTPVRKALIALSEQGILSHDGQAGYRLARTLNGASGPVDDAVPDPLDDPDLISRIMADRASGRIPPEVSENGLVARYGSPRGAVRKALQLLGAEGLVQRQRGHGWRFAESLDTEEAIAESYAFRVSVECAALRQPGYRADPVQLAQLRRAHEAMLEPNRGAARHEWLWVNADFHEALAAWSRNRFFLQAIRQQNSLRRMHQYADFPKLTASQVEQSCREHLGILDALAAGDVATAERRLRDHLTAAARE